MIVEVHRWASVYAAPQAVAREIKSRLTLRNPEHEQRNQGPTSEW